MRWAGFLGSGALLGLALLVACAKSQELLQCDGGLEACGAICVSLKTDSENCGKCGAVCPAEQACVNGACSSACPSGNTLCGKDGGPSSCVNTKTDNENCGACGKVCASGQVCFGGACSGTCGDSQSGQTLCGGDGGAPYCANLKTDRSNCGACGKTCSAGQLCVNGICAGLCDVNQSLCGADAGTPYCANLKSDNANCGSCGNACTGPLSSCIDGACTSLCTGNQKLCTGDGGTPYCIAYLSDNKNCGNCGTVCPSNKPVCSGGTCTSVGGGTVRDVNGIVSPVTYVKCGSGVAGACTEPVAEASCQGLGLKLVSHASNGTVAVVSLGATTSCNWSISYFTNNDPAVAGQCLVGVSNAQWTNCCGLGSWHGNVVTVPVTLGQQFGFVNSSNSGYNGGLVNTSGVTFGCNPNATAAPSGGGCTSYWVACK
jgi:hypothetical protein